MIVEGSPSRRGTATGLAWLLPLLSRTDPLYQPFCRKTLAVWDRMTRSLGSLNRCTLEVVSWVLCPALPEGLRASMPRVLETTMSSPALEISAGK